MFTAVRSSNLDSKSAYTTRSASSLSDKTSGSPLDLTLNLGTRSRREIGQFDRVFTTSGSVRRNFAEVFRFSLDRTRTIRIYLGNQFSNPNSNNRRMLLDLIDDRTLRSIRNTTVNPTRVGEITRQLNAGTYRISISTQSNDRGRYFMDMVRV